MAEQVVGKIPDFTTDEALAPEVAEGEVEEEKQAEVDEASEEGKETPAEPPADTKPAERGVDTGVDKELHGLKEERIKLLNEIQALRGQRREIRREEPLVVQKKDDDLDDLNPQDVSLVEKILQKKGYIKQEQAHQMFYDSVKQEELNKFLEKYPEYKTENDSNDLNWSALQREMSYYRMPDDPHKIGEVLARAHRALSKSSDRSSVAATKQRVKVASVGGGGSERSSSRGGNFKPDHRSILERGGWSEEEIRDLEKDLS